MKRLLDFLLRRKAPVPPPVKKLPAHLLRHFEAQDTGAFGPYTES